MERSCRAKLEAFGSDGRSADPGSVVAGDPRDGFLGLDASGSWTLFAADLSGGDSYILTGWSMEIIGVPEPGTTSLLAFSVLALFARRKR